MTNKIESKHLVIGAILGGLLIGTSTVLLTSRKAKKAEGIKGKVCELTDKVEDFICSLKDNTKSLAKGITDGTTDWSEKAQHLVEYVKEEIETFTDPDNHERRRSFLAGGILGGLLVAGAAAMMAANADHEDEAGLLAKMGDKASACKNIVSNVMELLDNEGHKSGSKSHSINELIDFAATGIQLWQKIKK